jgi:O-antigen/teichoic acid export membrane protein
MNPSQRIVLNTAATYTSSVLGAGLALFSSRWVLNALGYTDFGLFSLVGSIILFITFLNSVMAASASRHFAYYIGQGDLDEVNRWFNVALNIHLCLGVGLVLIGWPIGENVIVHILKIPDERISTCLWVFRVSLISAFISMVSIPFVAMFTAQQHIAELSAWSMLQSILIFILAYILARASGDRLLFYAIGMVAIFVFLLSGQVFRAIVVFRECRISCHLWFDKRRAKEIFSFATWNMIGSFGGILRNQGSAILLNLFFGPKLNAAYGIANQVSGQSNQLAAAMIGAFSPEITASEGHGDRARMLSLSLRSCKFGTIMVMLFAIPLMVEMDYILRLWLREPPPYTALFCQLMLGTFLIDRLTAGYMLAVSAHGKIAAYQATVGTSIVLTLPLAWLFLKLGFGPTSVGVAFIITIAVCSFGRVLWAQRLFGVPVRSWLASVVFRCGLVAATMTLAALAPRCLLPPTFFRFTLTTSTGIAASLLTVWYLAFDRRERQFVRQNARRLLGKIS